MRIADAVYLLDGRSRQLLPALLYLPTSVWVAGNCSLRCSTFPRPCGSPATAPCVALPSHVRVGRRQLLPALLYLPTSVWVAGNCSLRCSRPLFRTRHYFLHPWSRTFPRPSTACS